MVFDFITVGDATLDTFLSIHDASLHCRIEQRTCELCLKYGEKIPVDSCVFSLGGDACNVAVGLSRFGLTTALCVELGDDEFSLKIHNGLSKEHIDKRLIKTMHNSQTTFAIGINFQSERTLFVSHVKRDHAFSFETVSTKWLYLTSLGEEWENAYKTTLDFVKKNNISLVFAPGTKQIDSGYTRIKEYIKQSSIMLVNKQEAETILHSAKKRTTDIPSMLLELQAMGPKTMVITDGTNGSFAIDQRKQVYTQKIFPQTIVERTGAGDGFASGFLAARFLEKPIQEAMVWGTLNAGSVVGKIGAQVGLLTRERVEKKAHDLY